MAANSSVLRASVPEGGDAIRASSELSKAFAHNWNSAFEHRAGRDFRMSYYPG